MTRDKALSILGCKLEDSERIIIEAYEKKKAELRSLPEGRFNKSERDDELLKLEAAYKVLLLGRKDDLKSNVSDTGGGGALFIPKEESIETKNKENSSNIFKNINFTPKKSVLTIILLLVLLFLLYTSIVYIISKFDPPGKQNKYEAHEANVSPTDTTVGASQQAEKNEALTKKMKDEIYEEIKATIDLFYNDYLNYFVDAKIDSNAKEDRREGFKDLFHVSVHDSSCVIQVSKIQPGKIQSLSCKDIDGYSTSLIKLPYKEAKFHLDSVSIEMITDQNLQALKEEGINLSANVGQVFMATYRSKVENKPDDKCDYCDYTTKKFVFNITKNKKTVEVKIISISVKFTEALERVAD